MLGGGFRVEPGVWVGVVERLVGVLARDVTGGGPFCLGVLPPAAVVRFVDDGELDRVEAGLLPWADELLNLVTERGRRDVGEAGGSCGDRCPVGAWRKRWVVVVLGAAPRSLFPLLLALGNLVSPFCDVPSRVEVAARYQSVGDDGSKSVSEKLR